MPTPLHPQIIIQKNVTIITQKKIKKSQTNNMSNPNQKKIILNIYIYI
jgi:hypothetical protein